MLEPELVLPLRRPTAPNATRTQNLGNMASTRQRRPLAGTTLCCSVTQGTSPSPAGIISVSIINFSKLNLGPTRVRTRTNQPTTTDQPTDQPTDRPTNQPTNQPIDRPTNQPTKRPTNRPPTTHRPLSTPPYSGVHPFRMPGGCDARPDKFFVPVSWQPICGRRNGHARTSTTRAGPGQSRRAGRWEGRVHEVGR